MGIMGKLFGSSTKSKAALDKRFNPYIFGKDGKGGILNETQRLYDSGKWNDEMQGLNSGFKDLLYNRYTGPEWNAGRNAGLSALSGNFDPNISRIGDVNMPDARSDQGELDPTVAMQQMLSGIPNNPWLDSQASSITNQLTRNVLENAMPNIRGEAISAGQYGGSRQGMAEGLALSRMNQDLAPALTNLYGSAFENAQQRMYGTANALNQQAADMGQFNANLGLQNNNQEMQRAQQQLNSRAQGLGLLGSGMDMQDSMVDQYMQSIMRPNQYEWGNLGNYSGNILAPAQYYQTSKSTSAPGIVPAALGTAAGIAGIASGFMTGGKTGGGFGGGGGGGGYFPQAPQTMQPITGANYAGGNSFYDPNANWGAYRHG